MAHYAADCWDMEIQLSYGWIECVGHADRACYDLQQHSSKTGIPMQASYRLPEPIVVERVVAEPNKKLIGPRFKGDQKAVITALENLDSDGAVALRDTLDKDKVAQVSGFSITPDLVSFVSEKKNIVEVKYTPSVIEPSYGIGRIIYSVLEHAFTQRDGDEQRCVMRLKPCVAPIKVGIFRLINNAQFDPIVSSIHDSLQSANIANKVDSSSGTIGRRYSRSDELGIPFGITVDFQTLVDDAVTVRERDTMSQVRVPIVRLVALFNSLISEDLDWGKVLQRYPVMATSGADEDTEDADATQPSAGSAKISTTASSPTIVERTIRASFSRPNPACSP